jgi:2-polyprenyl-3-methyl-5-hydroxy-6-metoxy-1,4-benzoquinol methylase
MDPIEPDTTDDVEKYYDLTAQRTAQEWYSNEILLPTEHDLLTLLPPQPRILDFGCGPGYEAGRLQSMGANVTGIDISEASIRIAKDRSPGCTFIRMNFYEIDPSIGKFHAVWASGSLIHVPREKMRHVLLSIRGVLQENGILAAILRYGSGKDVSYPAIDGSSLERTIYRYDKNEFTEYCRANELRYVRDGHLDRSLLEKDWRCYLFEKK